MGSFRAHEEQGGVSTGINSQGVDDIREAGKGGAGTSVAGEIQADAGDVAAPNITGVQQHGAGNIPENEWVAKERQDRAVFGDIEKDLEKHDEREHLLAKTYRVSENERKERQERVKARAKPEGITGGTTEPKPDGITGGITEPPKPVEDPNECYIEIKNLVLIKSSVIHKTALEEWDRERELFASRVERKSTKVESRKNEVYQLIGFFSVFQGVVLTAVSQSNLLHCNNRWSPILLSLLASIVTIAGVFQKLMQISALEETIYSEEQALKDVVHRGQDLRRKGKDFVFAKFSESKKKELKGGYATWYAVGVLSFLVVFTAVFPLSHWRILCYPGRNPYGGVPPPA